MTLPRKVWCAACGKWGDHMSGGCPTITHPEPKPSAVGEIFTELDTGVHDLDEQAADRAELDSLRAKVAERDELIGKLLKSSKEGDALLLQASANIQEHVGHGNALEQERDALAAKVAELEGCLTQAVASFDHWKAKANHHRDLGITLLDAKYLDPNCWKGCKSLVHQHRIDKLRTALEEARDAIVLILNQVNGWNLAVEKIIGRTPNTGIKTDEPYLALAAISAALAPDEKEMKHERPANTRGSRGLVHRPY